MEKISFSLPSSSSKSKQKISSDNHFNQGEEAKKNVNKHFVTEFDPSKTLTEEQQIVIPPKENTWRTTSNMMKMMNMDLLRGPSNNPDLTFELEAPTTAGDTDPNVSYGLNLRNNNDAVDNDDEEEKKEKEKKKISSNLPPPPPPAIENLMLKKFKEDMQNLPDDRGFAEFDDVPVEGFGAALLRGYGWSEGKGIGRNTKDKEDVKIVQYVRRGDREGLGFEPDSQIVVRKNHKGGRSSGPQLVAPKGPDGRTRHVVGVDEKLVPREQKGIFVGKTVRIVGGRHEGLKGKVMEKLDGNSSTRFVLKLVRSGEDVTVRVDELAELGSVQDDKCLKKLEEYKSRGSRGDGTRHEHGRDSSRGGKEREKDRERKDGVSSDKKRGREGDEGGVKHQTSVVSKRSRDGSRKGEDGRRAPISSWLTSHIRVRIVNKDFKGGKLYLKKGRVLDVVGPTVCDISMDENNELIQGVDQSILETALPKSGGAVLILSGRHKGVFGKLVQKDMEKETGVVQDADSHELLNVGLEQIAEYIGDPSYIGY